MGSTRVGRWARWGWLATTATMGAALLAMAWMSRTRVVRASSTLNRGQGGVLMESTRESLRDLTVLPTAHQLDSLLTMSRSAGMRYIGMFNGDGTPVAEAGKPTGHLEVEDGHVDFGPPGVVLVGSRIRIWGPAPAYEGDFRPHERPRRRLLAIEFEPVVADQMAADATSTVLLSALVGAALLVVAFVFWRLSAQQELAERRFEEQRRLSALGEMAAVMAHEIRNPLASLKGHAQLLAERLRGGNAHDLRKADRVVQEAVRLETLTTDLLDFVRSGPVDLQPTDPAALVESCIQEVQPDGFALDASAAPATFPLDAARMRQAVMNILRNALQATPEGTRPAVTVRARDGGLEISVRDFGAGIAKDEQEKIFTPFYTTRTTGTGLGLAVAQRVTQMHGGTISATNHNDGGAVFSIVLPRG